MSMSAATSNRAAAEVEVARWIHAHVVPVLSEGVVCAMRDQPADPAAYMADFVAARAPDDSAQRLLEHRLQLELLPAQRERRGAAARR